MQLFNSYCR